MQNLLFVISLCVQERGLGFDTGIFTFNKTTIKLTRIRYLGGFWVAVDFLDIHARAMFQTHEGVQSWFDTVKPWYPEFKVDDRVAWVDVEGLPSVAWTHATFNKLAYRWGRLLFVEDPTNNNLWRKRMCVVTRMEDFIMESFKIIIKGNVYTIRAREVTGWTPDFIEVESEEGSDEGNEASVDSLPFTDKCSGIEGNGEQLDDMLHEHKQPAGNESDDPFGIYDILHKEELAQNKKSEHGTSDDPSHPPGFTKSVEEVIKGNEQEDICGIAEESEQVLKPVSQLGESMGSGIKRTTSVGACSDPSGQPPRVASSLLNKLNEFVEIGQAMGFSMEGCLKNIEELIL